MAYAASNVTTAKQGATGTIWRAPKGTTLPTDAVTALDAAFKSLGHISEDGVTFSDSKDSQEIKNMSGDTVLTVLTGTTSKMAFSLLEGLNTEVLKATYGDEAVSGTLAAGITANVSSNDPAECVWVFDTILREGVLKRVVIPQGKVTETDDVVYKNDEALTYGLTITASADNNGCTRYEYLKGA